MAALPIVAGDRVHFCGDSITAFGWFGPTGGLVDQINATWPTPAMATIPGHCTGTVATCTATTGKAQLDQPGKKAITVTSSGVVGNKAADIAAAVASRIVAFNPTKVVLEVVINDAIGGTDPTAFQASYDSIIAQTLAALPSVKFLCVSALCYGEQWLPGPAWGANSSDSNILALDAAIQAVVAKYSMSYVDLRAPLLVYEAANNTPQPGAVFGVVTADNTHPIITSGQVLMSTWAFAGVAVAP